ncbi:MAG TPA: zinc ribbon domain-containing protein [Hyphomicrobiales bacterium]|nr:zinc ribbon domain-containing protein [Hyphomicrobiales bacterium]
MPEPQVQDVATGQKASPMGPSMAAFGDSEACPNCGARMATDQRYCLNCGHRRGEPRLPFMDAVTFMESMSAPGGGAGATPPPPPSERPNPNRWNANAALIAGVATLVLAIGVGFLIGRTGHENTGSAGGGAVKVVQLGGAPAGGETAEATTPEETAGGGNEAGKSKGKNGGKPAIKAENTGKATKKAEKNVQEGAHGQSEAVENVLHTENGVELETEVEVGGKCKQGTAGCEGEKFTGNFFGE